MSIENPGDSFSVPDKSRHKVQPDRLPPGTGLALGVILGTTAWAVVLGLILL